MKTFDVSRRAEDLIFGPSLHLEFVYAYSGASGETTHKG